MSDETYEDEAQDVKEPSEVIEGDGEGDGEGYQTLAHGVLSPRHRRLALLFAQGKSNSEIIEELGYSDSRVSILKKNPHIHAEVIRLRDKIYEETIGGRLKAMAEPALNILQSAVTDRTNRFKKSEQIDVAKWIVEKIDGKAAQKHDIGENMLGLLMDRLDSMKNLPGQSKREDSSVIDVTPSVTPQITAPSGPKSEEDLLTDWVMAQDSLK